MKKKFPIPILLTFFVLFALSAANTTNFLFSTRVARAQISTTVYVAPELTIAQLNTTFSVNISIAEVTNLCSWQVFIYFRNDVLDANNYAEGPFLNSHGSTSFDGMYDNSYNETHGELWMWCLRTWEGYGVDGSGVLGIATFKGKMGGQTPLNLANTILGNSTAQRIDHTTADGTVQVTASDVAITSVAPCRTLIGQGITCLKAINVTATNEGDSTETFNVTSYANGTVVQTLTVTNLPPGNSVIITFAWDTTGFAKGNYLIGAYAWPGPFEADTADNNVTDGTIRINMAGDVAEEYGLVDIVDIVYVAIHFGAKIGEPEYDPIADTNCDDIIDIVDIVIVAIHFGETDP